MSMVGGNMGNHRILKIIHLPPERTPIYDSDAEFIWQLPSVPGKWIVLSKGPINPRSLDDEIRLLEKVLEEGCDCDCSEGEIRDLLEDAKRRRGNE